MLSDRIMTVFDTLMNYLSAGEYVILPKKEIRDVLGEEYPQREIDTSINSLQMNEFIKLRYSDSEVYCMTVLAKGILEKEKREEMREAMKRRAELLAESEKQAELAVTIDAPPAPPAPPEEEEDEPLTEKEGWLSAFVRKLDGKLDGKGGISPGKIALISGLSGFLGAFLAGIITVIIIIAKVG